MVKEYRPAPLRFAIDAPSLISTSLASCEVAISLKSSGQASSMSCTNCSACAAWSAHCSATYTRIRLHISAVWRLCMQSPKMPGTLLHAADRAMFWLCLLFYCIAVKYRLCCIPLFHTETAQSVATATGWELLRVSGEARSDLVVHFCSANEVILLGNGIDLLGGVIMSCASDDSFQAHEGCLVRSTKGKGNQNLVSHQIQVLSRNPACKRAPFGQVRKNSAIELGLPGSAASVCQILPV